MDIDNKTDVDSENMAEEIDNSEQKEYEKILESISELEQLSEESTFRKGAEDFPSTDEEKFKKLTEAKQEIFVELNMYILTKNDNDEASMPNINQSYANHYRIPLPDNTKEEEYMISFIRHFEKAMGQAITKETKI